MISGYLEYKVQYLLKAPIKKASLEQQKEMKEMVNEMLQLQARLYSIKEKFLGRISNEFKMEKLTRKLVAFYELSFSDFMEELKRNYSVKLSLKEQDDWEDYFVGYRNKISLLNGEIDQLDDRINNLVYQIYELTKDEKELLEGTLTPKA
jgi:hypothetical protein